MLVSIIIPCYNYQDFVEETITSVFRQSHTNIECIVVNDGSTDKSLEKLRLIQAEKYPQMIIIDKENAGLSAARNSGLKVAKGEYIAFIDADDLWNEHKIKNQLEQLNATNADLVFSDYMEMFEGKLSDHKETTNVENPQLLDFIAYNPCRASASSVMMKREVFEKVGFFDPNLRSVEDLDYWFRCSHAGFSFSFCKQKDVILRRHAISMMQNNMKMHYFHLIVLEKQLSLLDFSKYPKKEIRSAIIGRLGKIRWYAGNMNRIDLLMNTNIIGFYYLGFHYFNKLTIGYLVTDFLNLLFKRPKNH
jgi:glycosyltransferase involved in cell wall biosynthesis